MVAVIHIKTRTRANEKTGRAKATVGIPLKKNTASITTTAIRICATKAFPAAFEGCLKQVTFANLAKRLAKRHNNSTLLT